MKRAESYRSHHDEADDAGGFDIFGDDENIPLQTAGLKLEACAASSKPESRAFTVKHEEKEQEEEEEDADMGFGLFDDYTPAPSKPTFAEELVDGKKKLSEKVLDRDLADALTASREKETPAASKYFPEKSSYFDPMGFD